MWASKRVQAAGSGMVKSVVEYTGWMWGRWFGGREMVRLSLGPFLSEVSACGGKGLASLVDACFCLFVCFGCSFENSNQATTVCARRRA